MSASLLSPATRLGFVHLTVADLELQIKFYTQILGLQLHWHKNNSAGLGVGNTDLLRLTENKKAERYPQTTGLYHQAFLLPNRKELARAIARLISLRYPNSPTDHTISQTTYLEDPEGNTIELLADTPELGTWDMTDNTLVVKDKQGNERGPSEPLDLEDLFKELPAKEDLQQPLPKETITGHIHLYVNDLEKAMHFYSDILGFQKQNMLSWFRMGDVILPNFNVHVIAFNTWKGERAQPAPPDSLGMQYFTINLINQKELDATLARIKEAGLKTEEHAEGIAVSDPVNNIVVLSISRR